MSILIGALVLIVVIAIAVAVFKLLFGLIIFAAAVGLALYIWRRLNSDPVTSP